ncbi:hypothetical protein [Clostridium phage Saumur]|nr:hypothetical protein [Clostridium phage Saumur]
MKHNGGFELIRRTGSQTGQQSQGCFVGSMPARFILGKPAPENTHCVKNGSGHASYKACRWSTGFRAGGF